MPVKKTKGKVLKSAKKEGRTDWLRNQALVQTAYVDLLKELKRCPTILEVANKVHLSIKAIDNHVKQLKFEPLGDSMRALTPDVVASIYNSARKGQPASQKLWMQIMEGWREKTEVEHSGGVKIIKDNI
jgi:hypothetical protein